MNIDDAYLPKEITEIIAARRRQERAWHIRLSICASIYSNIVSTLSIYKEDTEREEAELIRKYLREAIACLAASNNASKPPKIPIATKPNKMKGSNKTNALKQNKLLIATPKHIICPNLQNVQAEIVEPARPQKQKEKSWAMVTRNGLKKSRISTPAVNPQNVISPNDVIHLTSRPKTHNKDLGKNVEVENKSDNRLFIRLPLDHEWRKLSPVGLREVIVKLDCQVEVSKLILMNEIERVSSKRPALVKLYGTTNPEAPHRTWLALFSEAPRCGFRVFDESWITKIFKKKLPIEFRKRCNGHHNIRNCSRALSCGNCGSTMHAQDVCKALTKGRNCGGPHRSDSHRCLARPSRYGKPTKKQLDAYRRAGDREYQGVVRANAAEARAAIAENTEGANETSSRSQETFISVENPNETPVQTQAGGEMRL
ncbi:putative eka-like protein [Erysiphe necator]|uniref:Putative eka-like protein n=1 Tax=Uncinula necator TaxID=52586 RepID=A0A0B1P966_UNCNE|nr:putative eka-like protein [Erysiphe necator]